MKNGARAITRCLLIPAIGLLGLQSLALAARTNPGVRISDVTVDEGTEQAVFAVSIDAAPSRKRPVRVTVTTQNGSAQSGSDFEYASETLTFERGDSLSQQFSVHITDDEEQEETEAFSVKLSKARNGRIIDGNGAGTILDNDETQNQVPVCSIDSPTGDIAVFVGEAVDFTATLSDPDGDNVSVSWQFAGGTPAGSNQEDPGEVTFPSPGNYTITLDASDNNGGDCVQQSRRVSVTENQVAAVSINSTSASGMDPYNFSPVPERPQVLGGDYSVFAVNDLGMHCVDLDGRIANILPPFQVLLGQVIQKGGTPTLNPPGISLHYSAASNPADPILASPPKAIAADGTLYKTNFWQGIPNGSYDAFYPAVVTPLASGPFPVTEDVGLPVPNAELLYLGDDGIVDNGDESLSAVQHSMPGIANPLVDNTPQPMLEHYVNKPFFIGFPIGYVANDVNWYEAAGIPMSPFDDAGRQNPFPLVRVEASDGLTVMATSDAVLPVSSETSCSNCHSNPVDAPDMRSDAPAAALLKAGLPVADKSWDPLLATGSVPAAIGLEYAADINILRLHDLKHGDSYVTPVANDSGGVDHASDACDPTQGDYGTATCLVYRALVEKQPVVCQSCHYTPALDLAQVGPVAGPPGSDANGRNQLAHESNSRVMHSHHGTYTELFPPIPAPIQDPLTGDISNQVDRVAALENNCYQCHPGKETQCLRGAMYNADILCSDCHGTMAQIGADFSEGVSATNLGGFQLGLGNFYDPASAQPRVPWANEPGCGSCHSGHANDNLTGQTGVVVNIKDSNGVTDGIRLRQAFVTGDPKATPIVPVNKLFAEPAVPAVFNGFDNPAAGNPKLYRVSTGHGGVMCEGCHGATHAEWPVAGANANDNLLAIQVQGHAGPIIECDACHTTSALPANTLGGPHNMHLVNDRRFWKEGHKDLAKRENSKPGRGECGNCHGADHRGTVLSRAAVDRSFLVEGTQRRVSAGEPVGCNLCHSLEKSFGG